MVSVQSFKLISIPEGQLKTSDFQLETEEIDLALGANQCLVQLEWMQMDASTRLWLTGRVGYAGSFAIGDVMSGRGIGKVIESRSEKFQPGAMVYGRLRWSTLWKYDQDALEMIPDQANPELCLSLYGTCGQTAYFAMTAFEQVKEGQTVLVTTAAGAVGAIALQIAKLRGAIVIGSSGTEEKCQKVVQELGADFCINYKEVDNFSQELSRIAPQGIDFYLDHVGGEVLDSVMQNNMNQCGTIILCGSTSAYNTSPNPITNPFPIILKQLRVQGIYLYSFTDRFPECTDYLRNLYNENKIKVLNSVLHGFENLPQALVNLYEGRNTGKMLVSIN